MINKKNIILTFIILFFLFVLINLIFFLVRYIILENQAERYLVSNEIIEREEDIDNQAEVIVTTEQKVLGKIAIVLDDLGTRTVRYYLLDMMPYKLNLAIIPGEPNSQELVKHYFQKGNYELLMHMPMEPFDTREDKESPDNKTKGYKYIITSQDNRKTIFNKLEEAHDSLLGKGMVMGMNNHMGSYITSSRNMINEVVAWAKKKRIFVLDSLTTPSSLFYEQARRGNVKTAYNQVFLDSIDETEHIRKQLRKVKKIVDRDGQAIAIGHIGKKYTVEVLFEWIPQMTDEGYKFVFISELVH